MNMVMNMNKKQIIVATVGIVLLLVLMAALTVFVLRSIDNSKEQVTPPADTNSQGTEQKLPEGGIDADKDSQASKIEEEANAMMASDPLAAAKKYDEAADKYNEAGNYGKSADMSDNAKTASSMTPPEMPEIGEPVISR